MSEDEAIEILKHVNLVRKFSGVYSSTEAIHKAIETILDLYKQEKAKAEEYRIGWCNTGEELEQEKEKNKELETQRQKGTLSDGFHTFNDLYYQRCMLFATICNLNKNIAWKSKKHNDGKKCFDSDEWFIVGIDTPEGTYTYHYEIKYWDLFTVQELEKGKEWDGHTEKDVTRLFSLTNNNINKEKIKAKIEELEKEQKEYKGSQEWEIQDNIDIQINILKELLEEE